MKAVPAFPPATAGRREQVQTVPTLAVLLAALITLADLLTPPTLVVGTLLTAPVALAALGGSRRFTLGLLAFAVLANVVAGALHFQAGEPPTTDLLNRGISVLATLLVGGLTLRARTASQRAAWLAAEQRRSEQERALRTLVQTVSGPYGEAEFVARAAQGLCVLSGAQAVEIGCVRRGFLRAPHATFPPEAPHHLNTHLPLDLLVRPPDAGTVWRAADGEHLLATLARQDGDLWVRVQRPQVSPEALAEAIAALQPLLERTALLDSLAAQRAQLAEQGEVVRDLIYAFSHDLRTPLLANALHIDQALRGAYGPLPEEYRRALQHGLDANDALLSLADQLLTVARYEGGEAAEEPQEVNMRDVVLGVVEQLRPRAQARDVTFELHLHSVRVEGSRHDLRRAVQNLLDNAIKFSPPGGTVTVELGLDLDDARLRVTDEGPGVPPSREATLFQRFRGGGAGGGSGLGLYLVRRIAEAHGGSVHYQRTARAKTVFSLLLAGGRAG
ncbi:ATP-binding protein [Deinococcus sp. YIM 77859]|uniref:sensor histidine kinase n=1 Tax=Deinococcus sp. YIM 77859 TaxID=1540221 RepID=UPI0009DF6590|nr:ATP-binding protein [Deinococcus sp. YIM 77859]